MRNEWSTSSAFVLQLGAGTDLAAGRIEGRIEHVESMRAMRFRSLDELLAFLHQTTAGADAPGEETGEG